jgi:integrase
MRKKGKSGYYYARFFDSSRSPKQKEIALGTTRKRIARQKLTDWEAQYERGDFDPWTDPKPSTLKLSEAIEEFLDDKKGHVKDSTLSGYRSKLEHFEDEHAPSSVLLEDVREKHLRSYIFAAGIEQSTKAMRFRHLRVFLNWAEEAGHINESPLNSVEKPKAGQKEAAFLKPKEVDKIVETIDRHRENQLQKPGRTANDEWLKRMITVAVGTGLRRGELLNLGWQDVDVSGRRLHIRNREGFSTKSRNERVVPLRGEALETLRQMKEASGHSEGPVFTDADGESPRADRVSKRFKFYVEKAGLDDQERISFHNLRHTTASRLAMQGVPMQIIQQILGHSHVQVTERYSHLQPDALGQAMSETFGDES